MSTTEPSHGHAVTHVPSGEPYGFNLPLKHAVAGSEGLEKKGPAASSDSRYVSMYASEEVLKPIPAHTFPQCESDPELCAHAIEDMRFFDSNPRTNLATFLSTWLEKEAVDLEISALMVNHADLNLYPSARDVEQRSLSMLMDLFHSPIKHDDLSDDERSQVGQATTGSTEAILLGLLAMKMNHRSRREAQAQAGGKSKAPAGGRPNLVTGKHAHFAVDKFAAFFDVELRQLDVTAEKPFFDVDAFRASADSLVDENTIGVCLVLGNTYTGHMDDVQATSDVVEEVNRRKGLQVGIHVDAASGGFVAPFHFPSLAWDFQVPLVESINVSGHKYGGVSPGVGWLVFRDPKLCPKQMQFHLSYMGSVQINWGLVFSKPASPLYAQYYQLIRQGREGFSKIMAVLFTLEARFRRGLSEMGGGGRWQILSMQDDDAPHIPIVSFRLTDDGDRDYCEYDVMTGLKETGWIVPAYHLSNKDATLIMRVCVRFGLTMEMVERLLRDIECVLGRLDAKEGKLHEKPEHVEKAKKAHPGGT